MSRRVLISIDAIVFAAWHLLTKIAKRDLRIATQAQNILFKDHSGPWLNVAALAAKELELIGAT
jgi:hypothetical protein